MNAAAARPAPARERIVHVIQGDFAVTDEENIILTTILGSCVAACLRDPVARVGGMNHFLLPGDENAARDSMKYGVNSMELLINALLKKGALRSRLEAKLFGGARVVRNLSNLSDIGDKNAAFAHSFLEAEGIRCVGESLGGPQARRVRFWPVSGRAGQILLDGAPPEMLRAEQVRPAPAAAPDAGAVELF